MTFFHTEKKGVFFEKKKARTKKKKLPSMRIGGSEGGRGGLRVKSWVRGGWIQGAREEGVCGEPKNFYFILFFLRARAVFQHKKRGERSGKEGGGGLLAMLIHAVLV